MKFLKRNQQYIDWTEDLINELDPSVVFTLYRLRVGIGSTHYAQSYSIRYLKAKFIPWLLNCLSRYVRVPLTTNLENILLKLIGLFRASNVSICFTSTISIRPILNLSSHISWIACYALSSQLPLIASFCHGSPSNLIGPMHVFLETVLRSRIPGVAWNQTSNHSVCYLRSFSTTQNGQNMFR